MDGQDAEEIKVGEKISILRLADAKTPVLIRKVLRDKKTG